MRTFLSVNTQFPQVLKRIKSSSSSSGPGKLPDSFGPSHSFPLMAIRHLRLYSFCVADIHPELAHHSNGSSAQWV